MEKTSRTALAYTSLANPEPLHSLTSDYLSHGQQKRFSPYLARSGLGISELIVERIHRARSGLSPKHKATESNQYYNDKDS